MKAVLLPILPRYCEKIASGKKTVEVRKTAPKIPTPFKCYIYETKDKRFEDIAVCWNDETPDFIHATGKVVGEFVCDTIEKFTIGGLRCDDIEVEACLTYEEMIAYFYKPEELDGKHAKFGYGWHISDLKIYDKPKELREFERPCINLDEYEGETYCDCNGCELAGDSDFGAVACDRRIARPPQSYMYVEELE